MEYHSHKQMSESDICTKHRRCGEIRSGDGVLKLVAMGCLTDAMNIMNAKGGLCCEYSQERNRKKSG